MIEFVIEGVAVGKGRPKFARRGNFVTAYTPQKTKDYEALVQAAARAAMGNREPIAEPVGCCIRIFVAPTASWSKKRIQAALSGEQSPISKPDIDNVIKGIFDACNGIVWVDDSQVVSLTASKEYAPTGRVVVTVTDPQTKGG